MSIFKEPIKPKIIDSIKARQDALVNRTPQNLQYYNSRNAWIRMSSAVEVNGDNGDLARKYVLQGGTTDINSTKRSGVGGFTNAYSNTAADGQTPYRLGLRPMPGITGIDIKSKSAYGSLREVVVNFNAWDIHQLEDLELLYMRPGYSVLVEWGWSPYLNDKGGFETTVDYSNSVLKAQNNSPSKEDIWKELYKKSLDTGGNYDAMYGLIRNYSWKARTDGGYDCTVTIISIGEILESLKVNYSQSDNQISRNGVFVKELKEIGITLPFAQDSNLSKSHAQNKFAGVINELYLIVTKDEKLKDFESKAITLSDGITYDFFRFDITVANQPTQVAKSDFNNNKQIYITLESLTKLINKHITLQDQNGKPMVELSTTEGDHMSSPGEPLLCLGSIFQISTNPFICQIKNSAYENPENLGYDEGTFGDFSTIKRIISGLEKPYWYGNDYTKTQLGIIGNIYVNLSYIYSLITSEDLEKQDKKEKNEIALFDFLKNMLNEINTSIGNVANLDVFIDPQDSKARIIDVNYADNKSREEAWKKCFVLEIQNLKSLVRNYSFESSIFPEQSTMVAIGAQAQGGALGENVETLIDFNQKLIDRIIVKKITPVGVTKTDEDPDKELKEKLKNLKENFSLINGYFNKIDPDWYETWFGLFGGAGDFDISDGTKYSSALRDIINFFSAYLKVDIKNRNIIPTKLSLEMDGIGGLIIGNMFRIPEDITPRGYKGDGAGPEKIAYIINGLGHSVKNNDWTTNIESQFILMDEPRGANIDILKAIQIAKIVAESKDDDDVNTAVKVDKVKTNTPIEAPSKDLPAGITVDKVIAAMQKKEYLIYANTDYGRNKLNIVGIKNVDKNINKPSTNYFSDIIVMFYYDDNGIRHERIGRFTSVPGLYYQATAFYPGQKRSIAMEEGQYVDAYKQGTHINTPLALVQKDKILYRRDKSLNSIYNNDGYEKANNATNIHSSGNYGADDPKKLINNWSAGCQVFRNKSDFDWMGKAASYQIAKTNHKLFTYTLLNIRNINGYENLTEVI